jgi:xanthine dehydrogenase accessory factor
LGGAALERSDRIGEDILQLLAAHAAAGTPCVLATVVRVEAPTSAHPGDKAVITADGRLRGWIGGSCSEPVVRREALRALTEGTPRLVKIVPAAQAESSRRRGELTLGTTCPSGGALDIFIEPQLPRPLLLVFGESPAAQALAGIGQLTGFRTRLVTQAELAALAAPGPDAWAVVATMGHYDEEALEAALGFPDLDVSLVASRRRAAAVREALRRRGLPESSIERVRAPAGRLRGATQEEIALLALADLVVRRRSVSPVRSSAAGAGETAVFATDPVCGMAVEVRPGALMAERAGDTHYFCSEHCRTSFLAAAAR